jgi:hypothetical protein
MNIYIVLGIVSIVVIFLFLDRKELFDIPVGTSTAWGWNTESSYDSNFGTGYSMYGIWPGMVEGRPWRPWMWKRGPSYIISRETQPTADLIQTWADREQRTFNFECPESSLNNCV